MWVSTGARLRIAGILLAAFVALPAAPAWPAPAAVEAPVPVPAVLPGPTEPPVVVPAKEGPASSIEELWSRGESSYERGDLDGALTLFEEALSRDRQRARSWNYVGGVYFSRGDLPRALEHFNRAADLDPRDVRVCNNLGTAYERLGEYARAEELYQRAALLDPGHALTQLNLGVLYARRLGLPEAARRAWERYLELDPAGPVADRVRAELASLPPAHGPEPGSR